MQYRSASTFHSEEIFSFNYTREHTNGRESRKPEVDRIRWRFSGWIAGLAGAGAPSISIECNESAMGMSACTSMWSSAELAHAPRATHHAPRRRLRRSARATLSVIIWRSSRCAPSAVRIDGIDAETGLGISFPRRRCGSIMFRAPRQNSAFTLSEAHSGTEVTREHRRAVYGERFMVTKYPVDMGR
jgi:hypothetical protein